MKTTYHVMGKFFNGVQNMGSAALSKGKELYTTAKEDKERYEQVKAADEAAKARMATSIDEYSKTCLVLKYELEQLERITNTIRLSFDSIGLSLHRDTGAYAAVQTPEAHNSVTAESVLNGVVVGSLTAGSAVLLTASFGTAGTGAAISGLTGTYALHATLAALGGGTLAAGGFGMAGGIAVASGLFVAPAVTVGAIVAHKKIQRMEQKVKETTEQVNKAVEINDGLGKRNITAAQKIRKLYDLGTNIIFLLGAIKQTLHYDHKIVAAVQDKVGKAFFAIKLFQGGELNPSLDDLIHEIECDLLFLNEAFFEQRNEKKEKYSEKEITPVFLSIYEDAREYLYLSYPWYGEDYVNHDLPFIKRAVERGVEVLICYGIGKINTMDKRQQRTQDAIEKMRKELLRVRFVRIDSHMKIAVCERYVLYGSQNMMSYRCGGTSDIRAEITIKDAEAREVEEFKKIIEREAYKKNEL